MVYTLVMEDTDISDGSYADKWWKSLMLMMEIAEV